MHRVTHAKTATEASMRSLIYEMCADFHRADRATIVIDGRHFSVGNGRIRVAVELGGASLDHRRCVDIIVHDPHEVVAASELDEQIVVRGRPEVPGLTDVPNARI